VPDGRPAVNEVDGPVKGVYAVVVTASPGDAIMSAVRRFMVTIEESNWEDVDDVELPELPREGDTIETKYGTCIVTHTELLSEGGHYAGKIVCRLP